MRRDQLEHVIRASAGITNQQDVVVIGSQALLGSHPAVPADVNTNGATGWCMEPHDLIIAKLAAGRDKDIAFATSAIQLGLVEPDVLRERVQELDAPAEQVSMTVTLLERVLS